MMGIFSMDLPPFVHKLIKLPNCFPLSSCPKASPENHRVFHKLEPCITKKRGIYWEGTRPKPWPCPSELRDMFGHGHHHHHHHHHDNNNNNNNDNDNNNKEACGEEETPKLISASNQHPLHLHRVPKETTTGLP